MTEIQLRAVTKKLLAGWKTLADLRCKIKDVNTLRDRGVPVNQLQRDGKLWFMIPTWNESTSLFLSGKTKEETHFKWAETADLHIGCKEHEERGLREFLDEGRLRGYKDCHIAGDVCDGFRVYRGHIANLRHLSAEAQAEAAVDILEDYDYNYYAIDGNHDISFLAHSAPTPNKFIAAALPNYTYLPTVSADLVIGGAVKRIVHGGGGGAYAKTYKGQVLIRNTLDGEGTKIRVCGNDYDWRMLQIGHYHTSVSFETAGIWVTYSGNWQRPNEFTRARGLVGPQCGRFVDVIMKKGKILEYTSTVWKYNS